MEDWQEKTVSMGNVDMEEFDTDLAHVRVSENRIHVAFNDHDDWKRIRREVGDEKILREVEWREVRDVDVSAEHLYFMHIDLDIADPDDEGTVEKRVYFLEDDEEAMEDCLSAIRRFWNAWRQKQAVPSGDYSYADAGADAGGDGQEDVDLAEAAREGPSDDPDDDGDAGGSGDEDDGAPDADQDGTGTGDDADGDDAGEEDDDRDRDGEEDEDEDDRGIEDIVKDFLP